jgi:hypothetical protein
MREECRLILFVNRVVEDIIRLIKSGRMKLVGHVGERG